MWQKVPAPVTRKESIRALTNRAAEHLFPPLEFILDGVKRCYQQTVSPRSTLLIAQSGKPRFCNSVVAMVRIVFDRLFLST